MREAAVIYLGDQASGVLAFSSIGPRPAAAALAPDAATGALAGPFGLAPAPKKALLVADSGRHRIVVLNLKGGASRAIDASAAAAGPFAGPRGVARLPDGRLVVADTGRHRLMTSRFTYADFVAGRATPDAWDAFGEPGSLPDAGPGMFKAPQAVLVDAAGRIVVTDPALRRLVRLDAPDGSGWTEIALPDGPQPPQPYGLSPGPNGGLLVTDIVNARVVFVGADDSAAVLIDGRSGRQLIAPVAAAMKGRNIVVADAAAAQLSEWARNSRRAWTLRRRLRGDPGPLGGPVFSRVIALAGTTTAIDLPGGPL